MALSVVVLGCCGLALGYPSYDELPANIPVEELPGCSEAPTSAGCENVVIYYLDKARRQVGLGPYDLPQNFPALPPSHQLLILSNLDRVAYGLPPVFGLTPELNSAAQEAVIAERDPSLPPSYPAGDGYSAWTGNWAGGTTNATPNAPSAYYGWVYDDGPESGNVDCRTPGADGCWGHRRDVLYPFPSESELSMGAGATMGELRRFGQGVIGGSFALLIDGTGGAITLPYEYTWAEAVADGAGSFPYVPQLEVELVVEGSGHGTVSGGSISCQATCFRPVAADVPVTLRATPAPGSKFRGWAGACSGTGACTFAKTPESEYVQATFVKTMARTGRSEATLTNAEVNPRVRTARFAFTARGAFTGFQCALVRVGSHARPRFATCRSPMTYRRLTKARYSFYVQATGRHGVHSAAVRRVFTIR